VWNVSWLVGGLPKWLLSFSLLPEPKLISFALLDNPELTDSFDYVVLDSPAGIESGARLAMYFCDDAIIVTNPELSALRDGDKMVGFIWSKSRRAELGPGGCKPVNMSLLINRFDAERAQREESVSITDMEELLGLPLIGVIPESRDVLTCTNLGNPVVTLADDGVPAGKAFEDMVDRFLGEKRDLRFIEPEPVSLFKKLFG
jgi:septum site-determining protein MinD